MINLLPPETKETYRYARRNRTLLHWISVSAVCLLGAILLSTGGYLYMRQTVRNENKQIASLNHQLQTENLSGTQKQVATISSNLKLTVQVLSKEILFSKLLKQLASITPDNVVLTNLSISQAQSGVDITAETTSYNAGTQLQVNLSDPANKVFSKADLISIDCTQTNPAYPCTVTLRALFAADNPFLFINGSGS